MCTGLSKRNILREEVGQAYLFLKGHLAYAYGGLTVAMNTHGLRGHAELVHKTLA